MMPLSRPRAASGPFLKRAPTLGSGRETRFIEEHGFDEYALGHLGRDDRASRTPRATTSSPTASFCRSMRGSFWSLLNGLAGQPTRTSTLSDVRSSTVIRAGVADRDGDARSRWSGSRPGR
jgi:hypothetical protein